MAKEEHTSQPSGGVLSSFNAAVENSVVGTWFTLKERKSTFLVEIRAGLVTFLSMAYILAVNANILTDSGGTCTVDDCTGPTKGQFECRFYDPGYEACLSDVKKSFISATAASSMIACILMGAGANLPLALAPGMGLNAYFTYTVVGFRGTGSITFKEAMSAIFVEGFIFLALALTGVRGKLIQMVPKNIMLATSAGIGMFLAHIGLQSAEGIGLTAFDSATLVTLGGCPLNDRAYMYSLTPTQAAGAGNCTVNPASGLPEFNLGPRSPAYTCLTNKMRSATLWLGIFGGMLMVLLMARGVRGSVMVGILFVTIIAWIPTKGNKAAYLGKWSDIAGGQARLDYFKKVVTAPDASKTAVQWSFDAFGKPELWQALITFLYVDFLDTTGTFYSMATFLNLYIPGFLSEAGEFPRQTFAWCVDGSAIIIGSLLGTSPVTTYIESATGIKEGGRTGITAITVGLCFFAALFITPILAAIPPYATGPALVLVGALMMENAAKIEWSNIRHAVPAFLTIVVMPFTYSIAYGVIAGLSTAIFLWVANTILDFVTAAIKGESLGELAASRFSFNRSGVVETKGEDSVVKV